MSTVANLTITILNVTLLLFTISTSCSSQSDAVSTDWSQWMGPERNGTWVLDLNKTSLSLNDLEKSWEIKVGTGYNSPTVAEDKVYIMDYIEETIPSERVRCLDAATGEEIWSYSYEVDYSVGYPTGPRTAVLVHDGKAYSFGTMAELYCFDAENGEVLWQVNGQKQYNADIPIWGMSSSPIIKDDLLILQIGGKPYSCLVAFNKDSGEEVWTALEDAASYSSPILTEQAGKEVLVCWTGENIVGMDPNSGKIYWKIPFEQSNMVINIAMPVVQFPYIFLSCFYDGSMLIELSENSTDATMVWKRKGASERKTDALHSIISTPFIQDDHIYGVDSYGEFRCLDLMTGERIWTDSTLTPFGRWSNAHFAFDRDKFWAFNETGELILGKVSPRGFSELGRVHLIDPVPVSPNPRGGVNWSFPAFAGRNIYVRSDAALICYQLVR